MYTKIITLAPHGLTDKTAIKIRIYKFVSHFHFFFTVKKSTTQKNLFKLKCIVLRKKSCFTYGNLANKFTYNEVLHCNQ